MANYMRIVIRVTDDFTLSTPDTFNGYGPSSLAYVSKGQGQVTDEVISFAARGWRGTSLIAAGDHLLRGENLYPYNPGTYWSAHTGIPDY